MTLRTSLKQAFSALAILAACAFSAKTMAADTAIVGNADAARNKISMCIGCHGIKGYKASFPEIYHVPKIAGQSEQYLLSSLKDYASGARSFPTMEAIAISLSEQDMADLAAYYSNLK